MLIEFGNWVYDNPLIALGLIAFKVVMLFVKLWIINCCYQRCNNKDSEDVGEIDE